MKVIIVSLLLALAGSAVAADSIIIPAWRPERFDPDVTRQYIGVPRAKLPKFWPAEYYETLHLPLCEHAYVTETHEGCLLARPMGPVCNTKWGPGRC